MLDLGWQEFLLIAIMAVIVVGPKDLPRVVRTISQWIRKARSLASEFQGSLEEVAREAELDDVRKQMQSVSKDGLAKTIEREIDPEGEIRTSVEDAKAASGVDGIDQDIRDIQSDVRTSTSAAGKVNGSQPASTGVETAEAYAAKSVQASTPEAAAPAAAKPKTPRKRAAASKTAAKSSAAKTTAAKAAPKKAASTKSGAAKAANGAAPAAKPAAKKPAARKAPARKTSPAKTAAKTASAAPQTGSAGQAKE